MTPEQHYAEAEALAQQGGSLRVDSNPQLYLATALLANAHALLAWGDPALRELAAPGRGTDDAYAGVAVEAQRSSMGRDAWLLCLLVAVVVLAVTWMVTR